MHVSRHLFPQKRWIIIDLKGPDSTDFLHRTTTINVKAMVPGAGSPGFFLNAQGKIRCSFKLWKMSSDDYLFEFDPCNRTSDEYWKTGLLSTLEELTFREKISVGTPSILKCAWVFLAAESDLSSPMTWTTQGELKVFNQGSTDYGTPWLSIWGPEAALNTWITSHSSTETDFAQLEQSRIEFLSPSATSEISSGLNPLELGMASGISSNKGCYPGQEVIEKIISLGSPSRRLVQIRGDGPAPRPDSKVLSLGPSPQEIGIITSAVSCSLPSNEQFLALALVQKNSAKLALEVQTQEHQHAKITKVSQYT